MTPQAQLAKATPMLYYFWLILLIALSLPQIQESFADDCPVPADWPNIKMPTTDNWITNAIEVINKIRAEKGSLEPLQKKDMLCKLAQLCATEEADNPKKTFCPCFLDKKKVEDSQKKSYDPAKNVVDNIDILKTDIETDSKAYWEKSDMFKADTKYMCIAYHTKDDKFNFVTAVFQNNKHVPGDDISPPGTPKVEETTTPASLNGTEDVCPGAPEGWKNNTGTTHPYWRYATNETINFFRQRHGASVMTGTEDEIEYKKLCRIAQFRADEMAKNDKADEEGKSGCGESIWVYKKMDKLDDENPDLMPNPCFPLGVWYEEREDYYYAKGPEKGKVTKHFTQMVWNDTKWNCVAYAVNAEKTKSYVVAEYWPPGNIDGEFFKNVFAAGMMLIGSGTLVFISLVFGLFGIKYNMD